MEYRYSVQGGGGAGVVLCLRWAVLKNVPSVLKHNRKVTFGKGFVKPTVGERLVRNRDSNCLPCFAFSVK